MSSEKKVLWYTKSEWQNFKVEQGNAFSDFPAILLLDWLSKQ